MLSHCVDTDKLLLIQQLCQNVLGAIVDGALALTPSVQAVVRDTLAVLTSPELKLHSRATAAADEEEEGASAAALKARATLVSKARRLDVDWVGRGTSLFALVYPLYTHISTHYTCSALGLLGPLHVPAGFTGRFENY